MSRRFLLLALLCLAWPLCTRAQDAVPTVPLEIQFAAGFPDGLRESVRNLLRASHAAIAGDIAHPQDGPVSVIIVEWAEDREAFGRRLGMAPEHIMAAADSSRSTIILNGQAFAQATPRERQITMTHEYVHLFLGRSGRMIPLWLEEGLAMRLSGDLDAAASGWQLTLAHSMGRLIPIRDLSARFPGDPDRRSLAYRQAYSLTAFLLERQYRIGGAQALMADLVDPAVGRRLESQLGDELNLVAMEMAWQESLHSIWTWIGVVTSSSVLWGLATALFIYAYIRRRRRNRETLREWAREDAEGEW